MCVCVRTYTQAHEVFNYFYTNENISWYPYQCGVCVCLCEYVHIHTYTHISIFMSEGMKYIWYICTHTERLYEELNI